MTNSSESYLFKLFELTCERYVQFCNEKNYEVSDFIRKVFNKEKIRLINKISDENFIYLKLCGNNKVLTKMRLTDEHIKGLCGILEEDESVKSLDLRFNRITDKGAEYIANLIKRNHSILEYNLMGNDIEEAGAKFLADAIVKSSTIKTLKMTGNKIGDFGGMQFAQAIQINESLEELDLGECDLKISSVISFATVLLCNTTLKSLNLDRPLLWTQQEETTVHMENMLYINKSLVELHLAKYEMRDFGMERLCDALIINRTLTVLDLSCNRITRDGAKILAKVLKCNTPLKVLDLGYNRIHDQGIKAIANSLCYCNTNLKCLVITFNEIHDEGLMEITAALELNTTLDKIYIWGNEFTSDAIKYFGALMDRFRLMESKVDVRPYSVDGIHQFALLPHNVDFRRYRYTAPIYGDDIPENRSYAIS